MSDVFGECRGLLAQPASEEVWAQLTRTLAAYLWQPEHAIWPYVEASLKRWPAHIPRLMPHDWRDMLINGIEICGFELCDAIVCELGLNDVDDFARYFRSDAALGLRHLTLRPAHTTRAIETEELRLILQEGQLQQLDSLRIQELLLGDDNLEVLCQSPCLKQLRVLELRGVELRDEQLKALCQAWDLSALEELGLAFNKLSAFGVEALQHAGFCGALKRLDLSNNDLRDVDALAELDGLEGLEWLELNADYWGRLDLSTLGAQDSKLPLHLKRYWRAHAQNLKRRA